MGVKERTADVWELESQLLVDIFDVHQSIFADLTCFEFLRRRCCWPTYLTGSAHSVETFCCIREQWRIIEISQKMYDVFSKLLTKSLIPRSKSLQFIAALVRQLFNLFHLQNIFTHTHTQKIPNKIKQHELCFLPH